MTRMRQSLLTKAALLSFCALISACASQQVASTKDIEKKSAQTAEKRIVSPKEAIALAEEELANAETENLAFFSPLHLKQASHSLDQAKHFASRPDADQPNAPIEYALAAREYVQQGLANKDDVLIYLKEAIAHKRMLQKLGVPELYPERYAIVLHGFSELIKVIEEGEPNTALTNQKPLRNKMYALEIDALIHIHLSEAMSILQQAEEIDAERFAPVSYYNAEYKINSTEKFIRTNYRDRSTITKSGEQSLLLAKEAYEVGLASKTLMNMNSEASEQYVLKQIARLQEFQAMLGGEALAPQSIERSVLELKSSIEQQNKDKHLLEQKVAQLESELKTYTEVSTQGYAEVAVTQVTVLETMNNKAVSDEPVLSEDEQGFDSMEYME